MRASLQSVGDGVLCFAGLSRASSVTVSTEQNWKSSDEKSDFLAQIRHRLYEILIKGTWNISPVYVALNAGVTCNWDPALKPLKILSLILHCI